MSGILATDKLIDGFHTISVKNGIPKLLLPEELYKTKEDVPI